MKQPQAVQPSSVTPNALANRLAEVSIDDSAAADDLPTDLKQETVFGIVFLHGLDMDYEEMEVYETKFLDRYSEKQILIINSRAREEKTDAYRIDQQAEMVYKEIIAQLTEHNKDSQSFPLFILGQSQGGVVAVRIAQLYGNKLNLLGFIPHHAPLKGADILTRGPWAVYNFRRDAAKGMRTFNSEPSWQMFALAGAIKGATYAGQILDHIRIRNTRLGDRVFPGVRDLLPDSPCIASTSCYVRSPQAKAIPSLLIAGYQDDYGKLYSDEIAKHKDDKKKDDDTVNQEIQALNRASAMLVTGDKNGLHDHAISVKSQLCRGDSLEDLLHIGDDPYPIAMPGNPNVTGVVIKGITHTNSIHPIASLAIKEPHETIWRPSRMFPVVFKFIEEKLSDANIHITLDQ